MVKISIVIPVYNKGSFLEDTLKSVLNQTLSDIEIIIIDDCSTDNSRTIINKYSKEYEKIKTIYNSENMSPHNSRKTGALEASGEFIMFVDADDTIEPNTCEDLYHEIMNTDIDILHFGTKINNDNGLSSKTINNMNKLLSPYIGIINNNDLIYSCFKEGLFGHNLANKLFRKSVCEKALQDLDDKKNYMGEDMYMFFVILFYSKAYKGINNQYYNYNYGQGISGNNNISIQDFERHNSSRSQTIRSIKSFLDEKKITQKYSDVLGIMKRTLIKHSVLAWYSSISHNDKIDGTDILFKYWNKIDMITSIAENYWTKEDIIANSFNGANTFKPEKKEIKTIGTLYHKLKNGGTERVLVLLSEIWKKEGYDVVVFTDNISEDDYELPDGVKIVKLPSHKESLKENYHRRGLELENACIEHNIDVMVYHHWASPCLLWDMSVVKSCGIPFILHYHYIFGVYIYNGNPRFEKITSVVAFTDMLIVLSHVDVRFWSSFTDNITFVRNPLTFNPNNITKSQLTNNDILWVGRVANEKNPLDTVDIMKAVIQEIPSAKLHIIGDDAGSGLLSKLIKKVKKNNLENNIIIHGFTKDVHKYYKESSIFLSTSYIEGAPMTILESKSFGLPYVGYSLPYLEVEREHEGFSAVPQRDKKAAADLIISLLNDRATLEKMGNEASSSLNKYLQYNYGETWNQIFCNTIENTKEDVSDADNEENEAIMWKTIQMYFGISINRYKNQIKQLEKKNKKIKKSISYRMGKKLTAIPRKIIKVIKK